MTGQYPFATDPAVGQDKERLRNDLRDEKIIESWYRVVLDTRVASTRNGADNIVHGDMPFGMLQKPASPPPLADGKFPFPSLPAFPQFIKLVCPCTI